MDISPLPQKALEVLLQDIASIFRSIGERLDYQFIELWIERKGLQSIWQELLDSFHSQ